AFGSHDDALGVIFVRGIPDYPALREDLLMQASVMANLQADIKERLTVTDAQYSVGWSHGKEKMNDKLDTEKGSFYANPLVDQPGAQVSEELRQQYPMYYRDNVWPTEAECPGFEQHFKALGGLISGVGYLLARHCDAYVPGYTPDLISSALQSSDTTKARLLHYFPQKTPQTTSADDQASWCGWHLDHSLLTGLTSAMYIDETADYRETEPTDPQAGLYIKKRSGQVVQVHIPKDYIAFQAGEALQVATGNQLQGTWHCVRSPASASQTPNALVARNTFAVFLQPSVLQPLNAAGLTFGEFSRQVLQRHY
ncbi:hypothetical protein THASP1DRAFT_14514, partial [Thamnocephalis sphaerospora]